jgi:hypothetical protein
MRGLVRNLLLAIVPVAVVWYLVTPLYNRLLLGGAQTLLHWTENPDVTNLLPRDSQSAFIQRRDFPPSKSLVHGFQLTDVHFHLILVVTLFLAVPGIAWRRRLENLAWAIGITVFFDVLLVFLIVKSEYATGLGAWSASHYGPFAQNAYGLLKHTMDLPFKLGLPFVLWAAFYFGDLRGGDRIEPAAAPSPVALPRGRKKKR